MRAASGVEQQNTRGEHTPTQPCRSHRGGHPGRGLHHRRGRRRPIRHASHALQVRWPRRIRLRARWRRRRPAANHRRHPRRRRRWWIGNPPEHRRAPRRRRRRRILQQSGRRRHRRGRRERRPLPSPVRAPGRPPQRPLTRQQPHLQQQQRHLPPAARPRRRLWGHRSPFNGVFGEAVRAPALRWDLADFDTGILQHGVERARELPGATTGDMRPPSGRGADHAAGTAQSTGMA